MEVALIVLLCVSGMTQQDCLAHRWLERYESQRVSPAQCAEFLTELKAINPTPKAGHYYMIWCQPLDARA